MPNFLKLMLMGMLLIVSCSAEKSSREQGMQDLVDREVSQKEVSQKEVSQKEPSEELAHRREKSFCDWDISKCSLPADHEAHFDPYYNGHLCENFDPQQVDFSGEYLEIREKKVKKHGVEKSGELLAYTFVLDSLFNDGHRESNGVIGLDYGRIRVHIESSKKTGDNRFFIKGKNNVKGNVCDFKGFITPVGIYEYKEYPGEGVLLGKYEFFEDSTQKHVGVFRGTFECTLMIDHSSRRIKMDERLNGLDGYNNRTYVGTWTQYGLDKTKKCIWGAHRLPFTFDFDQGDGEIRVNEKYVNNGWEAFDAKEEWIETEEGWRLRHEWWK